MSLFDDTVFEARMTPTHTCSMLLDEAINLFEEANTAAASEREGLKMTAAGYHNAAMEIAGHVSSINTWFMAEPRHLKLNKLRGRVPR